MPWRRAVAATQQSEPSAETPRGTIAAQFAYCAHQIIDAFVFGEERAKTPDFHEVEGFLALLRGELLNCLARLASLRTEHQQLKEAAAILRRESHRILQYLIQ